MKISIGGNIGCGKSTLLDRLQKEGYTVFFEPVDEWKHLTKFYENKERWSFTFQMEILNSFQKLKQDRTIYERSPWESYHIFSKMLLESGCMSPSEFELFEGLYNKLAWKPDLFIYLRTTPDICKERIIKRQRSCETNIDVEYLKNLHDRYEALYERCLVCVDANRTIDEVYEDVIKIIAPYLTTTSSI
tara:strand:- start:3772 stop:4338 length:567 start_codon:yes stop_codon:yes gene_type:complete